MSWKIYEGDALYAIIGDRSELVYLSTVAERDGFARRYARRGFATHDPRDGDLKIVYPDSNDPYATELWLGRWIRHNRLREFRLSSNLDWSEVLGGDIYEREVVCHSD